MLTTVEIKVLASGSKGNCYYVTDGVTGLLLDAGITMPRIRCGLDYRLGQIQGALITHEHKDHCKGIRGLLGAGVDVYATQGTWDAQTRRSRLAHTIKAEKPFYIDTWGIVAFETQHDAAEPVGYLLCAANGAKVLYATDTMYIKYRFYGVTHLLVECNHDEESIKYAMQEGRIDPAQKERIRTTHFGLEALCEFLEAFDRSRLEEIYLIHGSARGNLNTRKARRMVEEVTGLPVHIAGMEERSEEDEDSST